MCGFLHLGVSVCLSVWLVCVCVSSPSALMNKPGYEAGPSVKQTNLAVSMPVTHLIPGSALSSHRPSSPHTDRLTLHTATPELEAGRQGWREGGREREKDGIIIFLFFFCVAPHIPYISEIKKKL